MVPDQQQEDHLEPVKMQNPRPYPRFNEERSNLHYTKASKGLGCRPKGEDHWSSLLNPWLLPNPAGCWTPPCLYTHCPLTQKPLLPSTPLFRAVSGFTTLCKSSPDQHSPSWACRETGENVYYLHTTLLSAHGLGVCLSKSQ